MPLSLDDTYAGASANTYADIDYADEYFQQHPEFWIVWDALDDESATDGEDSKTVRLIRARAALDRFPFSGTRLTDAQALPFPRFTQRVFGSIPAEVKEAQCMMVGHLHYYGSAGTDAHERGISKVSVVRGLAAVEYDDESASRKAEDIVAWATIEAIKAALRYYLGSSMSIARVK